MGRPESLNIEMGQRVAKGRRTTSSQCSALIPGESHMSSDPPMLLRTNLTRQSPMSLREFSVRMDTHSKRLY
jgi:hypothetical protein